MLSSLAKSIMSGSYRTSSFICTTLFELGEIYLEIFFNPKYAFTRPSRRLFDLDQNWQPSRNSLQVEVKRLIDQGIVGKKNSKLGLTKEGRSIISGLVAKRKILDKKWDGKYRLVIFDIPEIKKASRRWLREELYLLQYIQLQKSVFIGKYPLSQNIIRDIKKSRLSDFVNYLLVDKIYDERKLKLFNPH
ncbi:MAG: Transcriptional regulator, PaaX family [Candidatus Moranbacteria bacterium GW2011_GWC1_45_18]|nr:MAG: Transcriptional regulator, PaaX family [Candidatus Moranbacteria bacterium GW2011_GWC2_40_12]KKT32620.1 MAG: Transcriptional regulator, PaaX family [Candidatus Moranbacteria bacterium GW2011_GWF2_44_10]KKU00745.1 MAG: Transcriptional regulator, PaaX family [Candidatus Moranbacteria bacterium GW2011_GWC1_45_18]